MHNVTIWKSISNSITLCIHMKPTTIHTEDAVRLLEEYKILRTDELKKMLECAPRTLYLKLSKCEYISSINKARRYFTLAKTPEFNLLGLWECNGVMFSKWGGIKETIVKLVNSSEMGLTPTQISNLLKTKVTPQLLACLKDKKLIRIRFGRNQVYFSADEEIMEKQRNEREKILGKPLVRKTSRPKYINDKVIINILVARIKHNETIPDKIVKTLDPMGITVSEDTVKWVFEKFDLKKTLHEDTQ